MHIKFWQQHCNIHRKPYTLHPGGIRTWDLMFCGRTRWPLIKKYISPDFGATFIRGKSSARICQKMGSVTCWAIFFTNSSGHTGPVPNNKWIKQ
jgi:hypothetical protein